MAVKQITESFQNDGNFSQLDLQDQLFKAPKTRIETFRCSHPNGKFGTTQAGTSASNLCSCDHLSKGSNRIFRHIFSIGEGKNQIMNCILEIRETFTDKGGWNIRIRDIDHRSDSYGTLLIMDASLVKEHEYNLKYKIIKKTNLKRIKIGSPLKDAINVISPVFNDIGSSECVNEIPFYEFKIGVSLTDTVELLTKKFSLLRKKVQSMETFTKNLVTYLRFGDFRDKCVHDGTNLIGENVQLASEYTLIRAYRGSLIFVGCIADPDMYMHSGLKSFTKGLSADIKPGVYAPFLSAYFMDIGIYRLGIDKVHSDYGGVPMILKPGSRLETNIKPVIDATKANETLANLAALFYQPQVLKMKIKVEAKIQQ